MVLSRLASPTIESFSLTAQHDCIFNASFFKTLDSALANKRVKNLTISCEAAGPVFMINVISLCHIFNCHSLVHLRLDVDGIVQVPNFVHLPNLQTLEISRALFTSHINDSDNSKPNIILSFPVLKKLISHHIQWEWEDVQSVTFQVPFLEMVEIKEVKEFCWRYCPYINYNIISEPSSCVNASVTIETPYFTYASQEQSRQLGLRTCILLQQLNINQVKHLQLLSTKVLSFAKEAFVNLPTSNMLRHLKVDKFSGEMLFELLLKSPYLTSLTIQMMDMDMSWEVSKADHAVKLLEHGIVPDCISNTLKMFKIEDFGGCEDQLNLVKYMIENAEHLKLISLLPSEMLLRSTNEMEKVKEEFFSYRIKGFKFDYIGKKLICDFETV